jgi:hypothetical protein
VREVMGAAMHRLEHHPPRWRVDRFPTEAEQASVVEPGVMG